MILSQIRMKGIHVGSEMCLNSEKESAVEVIGMVRGEEDAIYRSTSEIFSNFAEASVYENPDVGNGGVGLSANRRVESSLVIKSEFAEGSEEESSVVKKKRVAGLGSHTVVDRVNAALDEVLITLVKPECFDTLGDRVKKHYPPHTFYQKSSQNQINLQFALQTIDQQMDRLLEQMHSFSAASDMSDTKSVCRKANRTMFTLRGMVREMAKLAQKAGTSKASCLTAKHMTKILQKLHEQQRRDSFAIGQDDEKSRPAGQAAGRIDPSGADVADFTTDAPDFLANRNVNNNNNNVLISEPVQMTPDAKYTVKNVPAPPPYKERPTNQSIKPPFKYWTCSSWELDPAVSFSRTRDLLLGFFAGVVFLMLCLSSLKQHTPYLLWYEIFNVDFFPPLEMKHSGVPTW